MSNNRSLADLPLWADSEARKMMEEICKEFSVPIDVFEELVQLQRDFQSMDKRRGINDAIHEVLSRMD